MQGDSRRPAQIVATCPAPSALSLLVRGYSAARFGPQRYFCDDSSTLVVGQPRVEPLVPETALPEGVIAERRLAVEAKPLQERR